MEEEIRIINEIILEAIVHGGDSGGPYYINDEGLLSVLHKWMSFKGILGEFHVEELSRETDFGIYFNIPQIVKSI